MCDRNARANRPRYRQPTSSLHLKEAAIKAGEEEAAIKTGGEKAGITSNRFDAGPSTPALWAAGPSLRSKIPSWTVASRATSSTPALRHQPCGQLDRHFTNKDSAYDLAVRPSFGRAILVKSSALSSPTTPSEIPATTEANKRDRMVTLFKLAMQVSAHRAEQKAEIIAQNAKISTQNAVTSQSGKVGYVQTNLALGLLN
ncbi:hypothetical protein OQA88_1042 [Cercophora sp. LCS_1]